jgi:hypothetical protein
MRFTVFGSNKGETPDEKRIRSMNLWYFALIGFVCVWVTGAYLYFSKKDSSPKSSSAIDVSGDLSFSNFMTLTNKSPLLVNTMARESSLFTEKKTYSLGDIVVIRYFYVAGVVLEKHGDYYDVVYKDHNHTLQKITLTKAMLLSPKDGVLNPVSMLVD